ncbi:MAG: polysaccharide biosynthesis/export family protein [Bacteroidales bacterium]|nr:polysaccharide biosynthesis/export family protein [Bacteroidales bacterium]
MLRISVFSLILILAVSCIPTEKLKYTIEDSDTKDKFDNDRLEKTIQPYDYLYIKIYSLDERTSQIFEQDVRYGYADEQLISYEVSDKGYINFPFIGNIILKDLTLEEARNKLEQELNKYLTNISIRIRFVGNKITVLGEVKNPGNFTFFDEKITVFQALALASDVSDFGDKTKVTLVREKDNVITYQYLDLTNKKIAESENYYLLPNDILIVDPVRTKYRQMRDYTPVYLMLTTITTLIAVLSLF